jgi:hypothetical protein
MIEARLELQTLGGGRKFIGADQPGAESAGAVEILAHVPLGGLALELAYRAFVADRIAGDARECVGRSEMLCASSDYQNELTLIVERFRGARAFDRFLMRDQGGGAAHKDGRKFRNIVAVRSFLDVLEIVQTEADNLARARDRERVRQAAQWPTRRRRRPFGEIGQRRKIAIAISQRSAQIVREPIIDGVEVDHLIALDHAETRSVFGFEADDFHDWILLVSAGTLTGSFADFSW